MLNTTPSFKTDIPDPTHASRRAFFAECFTGFLGLSLVGSAGNFFIGYVEDSHKRVKTLTPAHREYLQNVVEQGLSWVRQNSSRSSEHRLQARNSDGATITLTQRPIAGCGMNFRVDIATSETLVTFICNERSGSVADLNLMRNLFESSSVKAATGRFPRLAAH